MELTIPIEDPSRRMAIFGPADRNLRVIRAAFDVRIAARNNSIWVAGESHAVHRAATVIEGVQSHLRQKSEISDEQVDELIRQAADHGVRREGRLDVFLPTADIAPRGKGQQAYIRAMQEHDLTICVGPAGTGKTYLAVGFAVSLLKGHGIKRIVLVRPAVEAGEKLGFLPGDMQAKVNPYLRPLFDAMHDMMTFEQVKRFVESDVVEVLPLAYMRGRTLNHAAIILDEAQNATVGQMLMMLTRLGNGSKMVITGDDSQSDLPSGEASGLSDALARLASIPGIAIVRLGRQDIVRHPLVQRIVEAYGNGERVVR